jgi:signal transduction histidine kinase
MDVSADYRHNRHVRSRFAWSVFTVTSVAYVAVVAVFWGRLEVTANMMAWIFVVVPFLPLCGAFLMWKRPASPVGATLTMAGVASVVIPTALELPTVAIFGESGTQPWMWAAILANQVVTMAGAVLLAIVLVVLPDGEMHHRRERVFGRLAWLVLVFPVLSAMSNELIVTPDVSFSGVSGIPSPLALEPLLPAGGALAALGTLGYLVFVVAVVLLFLRYRTAVSRERKQIRWVLYAGSIAITISLVPYVLGELTVIPPMQHTMVALVSSLPMLVIPASIVAAVTEPRWIDVDIVIRRSVVYGALSFIIFLIYVAAAGAFGLAAGSRLRIEVAIFLTVIVAVVFQPMRRWLQALADRLVFGDRPDKYAAVAELSATIEDEPDPSELLPRLVATTQRALRLHWVRVSLDDGTTASVGAVSGEPALIAPIGVGAEHLGALECSQRRDGHLDEEDIQLIHTLASQAGLVIANARLAGRIVNAAEAERRRIERNIHDGAQQELVALVARLGISRAHAENGGVSPEELASLQDEARDILTDLRELAQGIHPSVLSDGGILEAVEDRCSRLPVEVDLQASPSLRRQRFTDEVEGAAYFFVSESLANVLKHSGATRVEVSLSKDEDRLVLCVGDDGCGFDSSAVAQHGMVGLRDRVSALGGTVQCVSRPGSGTLVRASLPVE